MEYRVADSLQNQLLVFLGTTFFTESLATLFIAARTGQGEFEGLSMNSGLLAGRHSAAVFSSV